MQRHQPPVNVTIGDPMPRIMLPSASGPLFDSWDPMTAGLARVYWLGATPAAAEMDKLVDTLTTHETLLHFVAPTKPPALPPGHPSWILDRAGELSQAFGTTGALAIVVDAAGRVAGLLPSPTSEGVIAMAAQLYMASAPVVVQAKAPVLLLDRVVEPELCQALIDYWERNDKLANRVGSQTGNVVNADVKRRQDVQLDDPKLFVDLRDCLVRRVMPAMLQAFHIQIEVIEAPMIGCYDAASGGWFRRHRDNTSSFTTHRQFAMSLNLSDDYEGGEVRFPEFGRQLYRPAAGAAVVFSCSLLHEVNPVTRGRRYGAFTFLSSSGPAVGTGPTRSR
jgi:predicted 2-oxoglutarate/Fe(II)-dependent dioxygenase YbiX